MDGNLSVLPKASGGPELDDRSFTLAGASSCALCTPSESCSLGALAPLLKCIHDM